MAALVAAFLTLPAAVSAGSGGTSSNEGGGASYDSAPAPGGEITLKVASGAWLGRATRIRGRSAHLAGRTVAIERRSSRREGWVPVASVRVDREGRFGTDWTPASAGRHKLRALPATASSAGTENAQAASAVHRVLVYRSVTSTWYGPGFYGNRTACGYAMTKSLVGVAHRTLPCGTKVTFRNPANGRTVTTRVVDRGPYVSGRQWDLTGGLCLALDHCYTGPLLWKLP